jgi:hypothetical protein
MTTRTLTSEIENFRQSLLLSSLETEFLNCGDEERKTNITEIINEIRNRNKILDTTGKSQICDIFEKIDEMTLSQPWNKIPNNKKIVLIKQYVFEMEPDDEKKRNQLHIMLAKETLTHKIIDYDMRNKKISSINKLMKNDDDEYYIDKTKTKKVKVKVKVESDEEVIKPKAKSKKVKK